jgi:hypothetical protein
MRTFVLAFVALVALGTVTGIGQGDDDDRCQDELSDYQKEVESCLEEASTLDEAKKCSEM